MAAWRPLTARIAGKAGDFTEQSHLFRPGERVRKSLQILNDTRYPQTVRCVWQVPGVTEKHSRSISVEPGARADLPIEFDLPRTLSGEQKILAEFHYPDGSSEQDSFVFTLLPEKRIHLSSTVGVMDPEGSARTLLKRLGVKRPAFFAGFGMNRHGSSLEEIRIRRIADALRGILSVYPDFQMERQTVSDCFGDLGEFQRLFLSGNCDGWITFDAGRMTDFARLAVSYPQKLVPAVALLEGCSVPVPPFFSRFFCEDPYAKMRKLVTLYQQKAPSGEYPVSYKNISGKGEQR